MAFGAVRHSKRKVKRASRSRTGTAPRRVPIEASIERTVTPSRGTGRQFRAQICLKSGAPRGPGSKMTRAGAASIRRTQRGGRCSSGFGSTPTKALKQAGHRLFSGLK